MIRTKLDWTGDPTRNKFKRDESYIRSLDTGSSKRGIGQSKGVELIGTVQSEGEETLGASVSEDPLGLGKVHSVFGRRLHYVQRSTGVSGSAYCGFLDVVAGITIRL